MTSPIRGEIPRPELSRRCSLMFFWRSQYTIPAVRKSLSYELIRKVDTERLTGVIIVNPL